MRYTRGVPIAATSSENVATSASSGGGASAIIQLAAPGSTGSRRFLSYANWSYSTTPAAPASIGGFKLYDGTSTGGLMMHIDITDPGPGEFLPPVPIGASPGNKLTVELLQAGSSVTGRLNAYGFVD